MTRDDEFVAQRFGHGEGRGAVGIADDLHQAFAVAQVDEDDAAVIAAAMDPAAHLDGLAQSLAVDAAAVVGAFHNVLLQDSSGEFTSDCEDRGWEQAR